MKKMIMLFTFLVLTQVAFSQDLMEGTWFNEDKTGRIQFYEESGKIFGKIVWLEEPMENGKPKLDTENPDADLSEKPLMGLVFLKGFVKEDDSNWEEGTIYDPENGKTYSSLMEMVNPNQLDVRGYIGLSLFGRTTEFTRYEK